MSVSSEFTSNIAEILKRNRSYRRFFEDLPLKSEIVAQWIGNLRYTNSVRNIQPIKYKVITEKESLEEVYPLLHWAGYLKEWKGPEKGERPPVLVIQLLDQRLSSTSRFDEGIQLAALTLQASEAGYGCCIIGSFNAQELSSRLQLPDHLKPLTVTAIGKPREIVEIEPMTGDSVAYYRTEDAVHHVPKRPASELLAD